MDKAIDLKLGTTKLKTMLVNLCISIVISSSYILYFRNTKITIKNYIKFNTMNIIYLSDNKVIIQKEKKNLIFLVY